MKNRIGFHPEWKNEDSFGAAMDRQIERTGEDRPLAESRVVMPRGLAGDDDMETVARIRLTAGMSPVVVANMLTSNGWSTMRTKGFINTWMYEHPEMMKKQGLVRSPRA